MLDNFYFKLSLHKKDLHIIQKNYRFIIENHKYILSNLRSTLEQMLLKRISFMN